MICDYDCDVLVFGSGLTLGVFLFFFFFFFFLTGVVVCIIFIGRYIKVERKHA